MFLLLRQPRDSNRVVAFFVKPEDLIKGFVQTNGVKDENELLAVTKRLMQPIKQLCAEAGYHGQSIDRPPLLPELMAAPSSQQSITTVTTMNNYYASPLAPTPSPAPPITP